MDRLKEDIINVLRDRSETTLTVKWATLIGILCTILIVILGYLFIASATLGTRVSIIEQSLIHFQQTLTGLSMVDKEQSTLLREIREDQI
jgi:hypothetical protein